MDVLIRQKNFVSWKFLFSTETLLFIAFIFTVHIHYLLFSPTAVLTLSEKSLTRMHVSERDGFLIWLSDHLNEDDGYDFAHSKLGSHAITKPETPSPHHLKSGFKKQYFFAALANGNTSDSLYDVLPSDFAIAGATNGTKSFNIPLATDIIRQARQRPDFLSLMRLAKNAGINRSNLQEAIDSYYASDALAEITTED